MTWLGVLLAVLLLAGCTGGGDNEVTCRTRAPRFIPGATTTTCHAED